MSEAASVSKPKDGRSLGARLWEYQAERFPVFKHGALIVAFGASAVCLSALLRGGAPNPWAVVVAVLVLYPLATVSSFVWLVPIAFGMDLFLIPIVSLVRLALTVMVDEDQRRTAFAADGVIAEAAVAAWRLPRFLDEVTDGLKTTRKVS